MASPSYAEFIAAKHRHRGSRISLTCETCGADFERYPSQRGRFCSKSCMEQSRRHGSMLHCALCDSEFYRRFGEQDSDNQFCSRECYSEWRAAKRTSYPKDGTRHLHRVVAERHLGRPLTDDEIVHHIDENKQNAEPENLAVFPNQSFHFRCHLGTLPAHDLDRYRLVNMSAAR